MIEFTSRLPSQRLYPLLVLAPCSYITTLGCTQQYFTFPFLNDTPNRHRTCQTQTNVSLVYTINVLFFKSNKRKGRLSTCETSDRICFTKTYSRNSREFCLTEYKDYCCPVKFLNCYKLRLAPKFGSQPLFCYL